MTMITYNVKDIGRLKAVMPFFESKNSILYVAVWHPELTLLQNLLCNSGFGRIVASNPDTP